jgi:hypothetical protein
MHSKEKPGPKLKPAVIQLLRDEGVNNLKELSHKYDLTIAAIYYRLRANIPLTQNTHTRKKKRPAVLNGFKRSNQKKRDMNGEVKEHVSVAFRETYYWPLEGAKEWIDRVKRVSNIEMVQRQLRNKA